MRLSKHSKELIGVGIAAGAIGLIAGLASTAGHAEVLVSCDPSPSPSDVFISPTPSISIPPSSKYPNETNTGVPAGTTLIVFNGNMNINTANTIVDGRDIHGCVVVTAPGVIIRKSKITCTNSYVVDVQTFGSKGVRATIQDSEISCNDGPGTAIGEINVNVYRSNIHGCENGADVDENADFLDNYIHDLWNGGGAHTDGIQTQVGHNLLIQHNTIYSMGKDGSFGTSAFIEPSSGVSNITLKNNLVGGGAYTIYCHNAGSSFQLINNRFTTAFSTKVGFYGPITECTHTTNSGNVYYPNETKSVTIS